jgi:hypothetical protein
VLVGVDGDHDGEGVLARDRSDRRELQAPEIRIAKDTLQRGERLGHPPSFFGALVFSRTREDFIRGRRLVDDPRTQAAKGGTEMSEQERDRIWQSGEDAEAEDVEAHREEREDGKR